MLVDLLVQGGACVAVAALNNHNITSSNIERIARVMNLLPLTSLHLITTLNTRSQGLKLHLCLSTIGPPFSRLRIHSGYTRVSQAGIGFK